MNTKSKPTRLQTVFTILAFIVLCTCSGMAFGAAMNAIDHKSAKSSFPKSSRTIERRLSR